MKIIPKNRVKITKYSLLIKEILLKLENLYQTNFQNLIKTVLWIKIITISNQL